MNANRLVSPHVTFPRMMLLLWLWSFSVGWTHSPINVPPKTVLTVRGDKFCINGHPRFLVLASYFDALNARYLKGDLDCLHSRGFDGIRIFPNWPREQVSPSRTLFDAQGRIDPALMKRLQTILDDARVRRMIVDITFSRETVKGLNTVHYKVGMNIRN